MGAPRPWTLEGSSFPCQAPEGFEFWVHRDPVRQRVQVFRAGGQEGSSFGCDETLGGKGFKFSWAAKGSSFPRWAPGGFEFWVHRDPGRQRVRVLRLRGQEGSNFQQSELKGQEGPGGARRAPGGFEFSAILEGPGGALER